MKCFLAITFGMMLTMFGPAPDVNAQQNQPDQDGLLWDVDRRTGRSYPFVSKRGNPNPDNLSYIMARGKLDKVKYDGRNGNETIGYDENLVKIYVTKLDGQGKPVGAAMQLRAIGTDDAGVFDIVAANKYVTDWTDATKDKLFNGFPPGIYQIKAVASIQLTTPGVQAPPGQPPVPGNTVKREAILFTNVLAFP